MYSAAYELVVMIPRCGYREAVVIIIIERVQFEGQGPRAGAAARGPHAGAGGRARRLPRRRRRRRQGQGRSTAFTKHGTLDIFTSLRCDV